MGRRTILLVVAALIAVAGTALVVLYVRGADNRAKENEAPVQVLKATAQINVGETAKAAMDAGKLQLAAVPRSQVLVGAMNTIDNISAEIAVAPIYPGEQIISSKFGQPGASSALNIPDGQMAMSLSLSDTGRVAGFVNPGSNVAVIGTCNGKTTTVFPSLSILAVGTTTVTNTTTTNASGQQTTEQLPKTLFTVAVTQEQGQLLLATQSSCELAFALLTKTSQVNPGLAPTTVG